MSGRREQILTLDVSPGLDRALERAFAGTEFVVDRCGSEVAVQHKLRAGEPFLLVLENRNVGGRTDALIGMLDLARERGVPIALICPEPLPEANRQALSYFLRVIEPPIYPDRLFREVKQFQWREETVYVLRLPGAKARQFLVALVPDAAGDPAEHARLREFFESRGNRFRIFEDDALLDEQAAGVERILVLLELGQDPEPQRQRARRLLSLVQTGAVVPLIPAAGCGPAALDEWLNLGAWNILPGPAPEDALVDLYDSLRLIRARRT